MTVNRAIEILEHLRSQGYGDTSLYAARSLDGVMPLPVTDFVPVSVETVEGEDTFIVPVQCALHDDVCQETMLAV